MNVKTSIAPHRHVSDGIPVDVLHPENTRCLRCLMPAGNAVHNEKRVAKYEAELAALQEEHRRRAGETDTIQENA
jgi:hypothetical protein